MQYAGFLATLDHFDDDCRAKGLAAPRTDTRARAKEASEHVQGQMISSLELGDFEQFFYLWGQHIPAHVRQTDSTAHKLEFYAHILFAIQPTHPFSKATKVGLSQPSNLASCMEFLRLPIIVPRPSPQKEPWHVYESSWKLKAPAYRRQLNFCPTTPSHLSHGRRSTPHIVDYLL